MSDIRFNQWLHQSGTGGVTQISSGHVGIGTTSPLIPVHSGNTSVLNVGVVTANNIYAGTLNGTLALSNISGITGSFTSDVTVNGNLDIADKIRHIGDTNTAIRFPAADTITAETGGSERVRITSTGLFGIGITPTAKLHVNGVTGTDIIAARSADSNGNSIINIISEGTTGNSRINFSDTAGIDGQISYSHNARALIFAAGGTTEQLRIDSSGRLIQRYSADPYNNRAATFQSPSGIAATYISIINTETNGQSGITFGDHAGQNAGNFDGYINYDHANSSMAFMVGGGNERLRIDSSGRLLVNTTSGHGTLQVHDGSIVHSKPSGGGTRNWRFVNNNTAAGDYGIQISNASGSSTYVNHTELKAGGDVHIHDGNLKVASGHGINFHNYATSGNPSSNLLDDYEEGTWTPQVLNGWGILNPTYSEQAGVYIKIGKLVHVTFRLKLSGGSTNGNRVAVSGFPFTAVTIGTAGYSNGGYVALNGYCDSASSNAQSVFCMVGRSGTTAELFHRENTGESSFTGTELGASGSSFNFSGTYTTP